MKIVNLFAILFFILAQLVFAQDERPNILWITIEDTSPQFIGAYGNSDAETPRIDKLADEGVLFTNAFSTGSVCSPSRSTIITGVRTFKMGTGNHRSSYPIPDYIEGFPYYMQQQGYYTTNNSKTDYSIANRGAFTRKAWDESSNRAGWWNRESGQPFFAVFNYADSHQSRTMTNSYSWYKENILEKIPEGERIPDTAFPMPPFYRDTPEMRKQFARVYNSLKRTDTKVGSLLDRLKEDQLMDDTIIFFYADHGEGIPRGKTNGINLGYRVPFIVWFPEKYKDLSPWGTDGAVTNELVSFEDLAPTVIDLSGGVPPEHMKGRILMGEDRSDPVDHLILSSDRSDNGIDMVRSITNGRYVYSRNYMPFVPELHYIRYMEIGAIKQHMRDDLEEGKLNPLQKSMFEPRPAEYLFDIQNDMWETDNLVDDPDAKPVLDQMRQYLEEEVTQARDIMYLPEYELAEISKTTTPYEYRLDEERYPFRDIYGAASLAGKRGKEIATQQIDLLSDANKILRYWGIFGLRSQPAQVLRSYRREIIQAMNDPYPPVAVTASAIAYEQYDLTEAENNLKSFAESDNMHVALMAVNYMLYVEDQKPFIDTVEAVYEMDGRSYNVRASCLDFLGSLGLVPNDFEHRR